MGIFNRNNNTETSNVSSNVSSVEEEEYGLLIHFTPVATYVYFCEDGFLESLEGSTITIEDMKGREIQISGTFISLTINSKREIEDIIYQYRLKDSPLPVIQLECKEY